MKDKKPKKAKKDPKIIRGKKAKEIVAQAQTLASNAYSEAADRLADLGEVANEQLAKRSEDLQDLTENAKEKGKSIWTKMSSYFK